MERSGSLVAQGEEQAGQAVESYSPRQGCRSRLLQELPHSFGKMRPAEEIGRKKVSVLLKVVAKGCFCLRRLWGCLSHTIINSNNSILLVY